MTVRPQLEALRVFYRFLIEDEVIGDDQNPMHKVKCIRKSAPDIEPLTEEEIGKFLGTFDLSRRTDYRNWMLCSLILDTGLRASEALGLTLDDIDLKEGSLRVNGKGNKKRTAYIGQRIQEKLLAYLKDCHPFIENGHRVLFPPAGLTARRAVMTSKYLSHIVTEKFDRVGIKRMHSATHRLRHTFAIFFLRNGGDAFSLQRLLGHYDLEMTKRYVRLAQQDLKAAHQKASPMDHLGL